MIFLQRHSSRISLVKLNQRASLKKLSQAIDSIDEFFGKHTVHLGTTAKALSPRTDIQKGNGKNGNAWTNSRAHDTTLRVTMTNRRSFFDRFAIPFGGSVA